MSWTRAIGIVCMLGAVACSRDDAGEQGKSSNVILADAKYADVTGRFIYYNDPQSLDHDPRQPVEVPLPGNTITLTWAAWQSNENNTRICNEDCPQTYSAITDADGRFVIWSALFGDYKLTWGDAFNPSDHEWANWGDDGSTIVNVDVTCIPFDERTCVVGRVFL